MGILTTILKLRRPSADGSDPANLHTIIGNLADDVDKASAPAFTTAALTALPAAERPAGRFFYDTTTGQAKVSNGAALTPLATVAYADAAAAAAVPVGTIVAYGGSVAPAGWHLCDGSAHGSSALQSVLGATTTPDLRSRFVVGAGQGAGLTSRALKATGGQEKHTLSVAEMPAHDHAGSTGAAGAHDHGGTVAAAGIHSHGGHTGYDGTHHHGGYRINWLSDADDAGTGLQMGRSTDGASNVEAGSHRHTIGSDGSHSHTIANQAAHSHTISAQGGGTAHENMPPFYALTYIIRKG